MDTFEEFFAHGREQSVSPLFTHSSRKWAEQLSLKNALACALLLGISYVLFWIHPPTYPLVLLFVYFLSGTPAVIRTIEDLQQGNINIDLLMVLAAFLCVFIGSPFEGALLLVLFELSHSVERSVTQKTKRMLTNLHTLTPRQAWVLNAEGHATTRPLQQIDVGMHLLIKAGEIVPLDGVVIQGSAFVNLLPLTGEAHPETKTLGDELPAGAQTVDGSLVVRVTRVSADSTLARIIRLITEAQEAKPRVGRLIDRLGRPYVLTVLLLACAAMLLLPQPFSGPGGALYRALAFLIAASPCALIISTPATYLSAISSCAKRGILLKGGAILDALARCDTIAFDKTGTLTTGRLQCTAIEPLSDTNRLSATQALSIAASLERGATHPMAEAICQKANALGLPFVELSAFRAEAGAGVQGVVQLPSGPASVLLGHARFLCRHLPTLTLPTKPGLACYLLICTEPFALHFEDATRPNLASMIADLKKEHRVVMLSGDHADNAHQVGQALGIEEIYANLSPEDKLSKVKELSKLHNLIMVGDGINDAPALAGATVGISMGGIASHSAVSASDVVFLHDDLLLLSWLKTKAKATSRILKQNLCLCLGIILFGSALALGGTIPLWAAVVAHEGGSLLVALNGLRLLRS